MRRPTQLIAAALIGLLFACGGSQRAAEKPSVVVLDVKGSKAKKLRGQLVDVVKSKDYPLLTRKSYDRTANKLGASKIKRRNVRKVAKEIGAGAVITGRLKRRGKKYTFTVTVRDGKTGKRVERFNLKLKKRRLTDKDRSRLEDKLFAALAQIKPPPPPDDDEGKGEKVAESSKKKKAKKKKANRKKEKAKKEKAKKKEKLAKAEKRRREREAKAEREAEREAGEAREAEEARETEAERKADAKRERAAAKKAEKRERKLAKKAAKADKKRKAKERALAKKAAKADKKRKAKERKRAERQRKKREAEEKRRKEEEEKVELPSVGDDGQAIDDETPGGL